MTRVYCMWVWGQWTPETGEELKAGRADLRREKALRLEARGGARAGGGWRGWGRRGKRSGWWTPSNPKKVSSVWLWLRFINLLLERNHSGGWKSSQMGKKGRCGRQRSESDWERGPVDQGGEGQGRLEGGRQEDRDGALGEAIQEKGVGHWGGEVCQAEGGKGKRGGGRDNFARIGPFQGDFLLGHREQMRSWRWRWGWLQTRKGCNSQVKTRSNLKQIRMNKTFVSTKTSLIFFENLRYCWCCQQGLPYWERSGGREEREDQVVSTTVPVREGG